MHPVFHVALLWKDAVRGPGEEIKARDKKEDNRPLSEVIMIEEDERTNFVPDKILETKGNKYLIRCQGLDEASDVWLSKSMTQRGSAIHQMMTAKDEEEETVKAVQAIDKATAVRKEATKAHEGSGGGTGGLGRPKRTAASVYRRD